jgi:hypothetical protein
MMVRASKVVVVLDATSGRIGRSICGTLGTINRHARAIRFVFVGGAVLVPKRRQ